MESGKHFVLVHGSGHGAWCWYKLVTLLKSVGHSVTALDLAASGVDSRRPDEIASLFEYVQPLMDFMASLPHGERVVLVGHSYGGFCISLAMESFPEKISVAIFIAAFMPNHRDPPATCLQEFFRLISSGSPMDCQITFDKGPEKPPTSILFGPEFMATKFYINCQPEDIELAKMLVRPSGPRGFFFGDLTRESLLTEEKFGSVSRAYVVCKSDHEELQKWMIEHSPTEEVKYIAEADHMAMLSKPKELSLCLLEIAQKYH
ncbi:methylesterase 10-like isoform X1 [Cornus florida]|uniref:methylesterase 10-like isoform X1 n=1 Tax=Cornus florida TaxID=4283 RepID=UPI0028A0119F|nr:methylesterase 10-like isoform X1 [Cornus florida]